MRGKSTVAAIVAAGIGSALAFTAHATITVQHISGESMFPSDFTITNVGTNLYDIELLSFSGGLFPDFLIQADAGENINQIKVNLAFTIGTVTLTVENKNGTAGINDVNDITVIPRANQQVLLKLLDINGDLGSVAVDGIDTVISQFGSINGPITAYGPIGSVAALKDIKLIRAKNGPIAGNITSQEGLIDDLVAANIGTAAAPVTISAHAGIIMVMIARIVISP